MKVKVYNLEGQATDELELSERIFGVKVKPALIHEVYTQMMANQRRNIADTKGKGEVRGGGKKPWQQKGTGRARHGSIRSPLWKGGGVIFGPKAERNYKTKINDKTRRLAIKMCLSDKVAQDNLMVVTDFNFSAPKTKLFHALLRVLPARRSYLVLTADKNEAVLRMAGNLPRVTIGRAGDFNVVEALNNAAVLTDKAGVAKLEAVFGR